MFFDVSFKKARYTQLVDGVELCWFWFNDLWCCWLDCHNLIGLRKSELSFCCFDDNDLKINQLLKVKLLKVNWTFKALASIAFWFKQFS